MDPYAKNPYSLQWNFGVQHQINTTTMVTANYVGSGSRRLDVGGYYNVALTPGPGNPRDRSPFPYIAPTYYDRSWGNSNYNGFQFELNKRMSKGLIYMVSYTWSKSIDHGCSGWYGVEGCATQDPYHLKLDRSVSGFDLRHFLAVNWLYQLPIGAGKSFQTGNHVADYIIGGWQINGIATFRSGQPYNVNLNGDVANTGNINGQMRPNLLGNPVPQSRSTNKWLEPSAFAPPPQYTFGTVGRYPLRSDWFKNFDLSVFRQFPIKENKSFEFRAEAFNAFNNVTYAAPVGNLSNVNFGRILGTASASRQLQLGAKILF